VFQQVYQVATSLLGMPETDKVQAKAESDEFLRKGTTFKYFGIALAVLSLLSWIASEFRNEPTWRLIPLGLLVFYLFIQLIQV